MKDLGINEALNVSYVMQVITPSSVFLFLISSVKITRGADDSDVVHTFSRGSTAYLSPLPTSKVLQDEQYDFFWNTYAQPIIFLMYPSKRSRNLTGPNPSMH